MLYDLKNLKHLAKFHNSWSNLTGVSKFLDLGVTVFAFYLYLHCLVFFLYSAAFERSLQQKHPRWKNGLYLI